MAPLELQVDGVEYLLHSSASVRQSIDEVPPYDEGRDDPSLAVVSESVVDIESNQKTTHCEVRYLLAETSTRILIHGPISRFSPLTRSTHTTGGNS